MVVWITTSLVDVEVDVEVCVSSTLEEKLFHEVGVILSGLHRISIIHSTITPSPLPSHKVYKSQQWQSRTGQIENNANKSSSI